MADAGSAMLDKSGAAVLNRNRLETRVPASKPSPTTDVDIARLKELLGERPVVLIGMMGAGKTSVGRRLATLLDWSFVDSDAEIEEAAGMSIPDFFAAHGEADFRSGEARVIARLLKEPGQVLATGGGAFMNPETRDLIRQAAISVFIKADLELLFERVSRRATRPLLQTADPKGTLARLIEERYPVYEEADIIVTSADVPQDRVAGQIAEALLAHLSAAEPERSERA